MIHFRLATNQDVSHIANLHAISWQNTYRGMVGDDYLDNQVADERMAIWQNRFKEQSANQFVLVAEAQNKLVGFICVYHNHHPEYGSLIDNLHVHPDNQGQGLGKQLLQNGFDWLAKQNELPVYLELLAENHGAGHFYRKLGAEKVAEGCWHSPCGNQIPEWVLQWSKPLLVKA